MRDIMRKPWKVGVVLLALAMLLGGRALAQGQPLSLSWWSVAGGGGSSSDGALSLSGSAGQAAAGSMSGGEFRVQAGFWNDDVGRPWRSVHIPLIVR